MFIRQLSLADSVGSDRPVAEEDTINTKIALNQLGRYDIPKYGLTPYPDEQMFQEIGKFQKEKKLYQDRIMNPNGETETAINKELQKLTRNPYVRPMVGRPGDNRLPKPPSDDQPPLEIIPEKCQWIQDEIDDVRESLRENRDDYGNAIDTALGTRLVNQLKKLEDQLADCKWNRK